MCMDDIRNQGPWEFIIPSYSFWIRLLIVITPPPKWHCLPYQFFDCAYNFRTRGLILQSLEMF